MTKGIVGNIHAQAVPLLERVEPRILLTAAPLPEVAVVDLPQMPPTVITDSGNRYLLDYFNNNSTMADDVKVSYDSNTDSLVTNRPGWWVINYPLSQISGLPSDADTVASILFGAGKKAEDVENWYILTPVDSAHPLIHDGTDGPIAPSPITLSDTTGATVMTVDQTYTSSTSGWGTTAFSTISSAINAISVDSSRKALAKTIIRVRAGSKPYYEFVDITKSGTETKPIIIEGIPDSSGNLPVVSGLSLLSAGTTWQQLNATSIYRTAFPSSNQYLGMVGQNDQMLIERSDPLYLQPGESSFNFSSDEYLLNRYGMVPEAGIEQMPSVPAGSWHTVQTDASDPLGGTMGDMAGYWSLDYTYSDSSANKLSTTLYGTNAYGYTWLSAQAGLGMMMQFDGSANYLSVTDKATPVLNFGTGAITLSAWVKLPSGAAAGLYPVMQKGVGQGGSWWQLALDSASNGLAFTMYDSSRSATLTVAPDAGHDQTSTLWDGNWHMVGFTRSSDGLTCKLYVDAVQAAGSVSATALSGDNGSNLLIGRSGSTYYRGYMDEARLYARELAAGDISALKKPGTLNFDNIASTLNWSTPSSGTRAADKVVWVSTWVYSPYDNTCFSSTYTYGPFQTGPGPGGRYISNRPNSYRMWVNGSELLGNVFVTKADDYAEYYQPHPNVWGGGANSSWPIFYNPEAQEDWMSFHLSQGWNHIVFQFDTSTTNDSGNTLGLPALTYRFEFNESQTSSSATVGFGAIVCSATRPADLSVAPTGKAAYGYISEYSVLDALDGTGTSMRGLYVNVGGAPAAATIGIQRDQAGVGLEGDFNQLRGMQVTFGGVGVGGVADTVEHNVLKYSTLNMYGGGSQPNYMGPGNIGNSTVTCNTQYAYEGNLVRFHNNFGTIPVGLSESATYFVHNVVNNGNGSWTFGLQDSNHNNVTFSPGTGGFYMTIRQGSVYNAKETDSLTSANVDVAKNTIRLAAASTYAKARNYVTFSTSGGTLPGGLTAGYLYQIASSDHTTFTVKDPSTQEVVDLTSAGTSFSVTFSVIMPSVAFDNWIEYSYTTGFAGGNTDDFLTADNDDYPIPGRTAFVITYNHVLDTDWSGYMPTWHGGGVKMFYLASSVLAYNVFDGDAHMGIWLDTAHYNNRLEGNLFLNMRETSLAVEASPGPNLLANNIMLGRRDYMTSCPISTWCDDREWAVNNTIDMPYTTHWTDLYYSQYQNTVSSPGAMNLSNSEWTDRGTLWNPFVYDPSQSYINNLILGGMGAAVSDSPTNNNIASNNYTDNPVDPYPNATQKATYLAHMGLVDEAGGDYRLQASSPLNDAGYSGVLWSDPSSSRTLHVGDLVTHDYFGLLRFAADGNSVGAARAGVQFSTTTMEVEFLDGTTRRITDWHPGFLVARWRLDENSGTTAHNSTDVTGLDGTVGGAATWDAGYLNNGLRLTGAPNTWMYTAGTGALLDVGTGALTVSAWVKLAAGVTLTAGSGQAYTIVEHGSSGQAYFKLLLSTATGDNGLTYVDSNAGGTAGLCMQASTDKTSIFNDHLWHLVTAVKNGSSLLSSRLYIDGIEVGGPTAGGPWGRASSLVSPDNADSLRVGYGGNVSPGLFNGGIDEVRFYSRALAASEIAAQANPDIVSVVASDSRAVESGDAGAFTFTRQGSTAAALTINYTISGTANGGTDYAALSGSVIIPAGAYSETIVVAPLQNTLVEKAETVVLSLTANSKYSFGVLTSGTVTIADDDQPTVSIVTTDAASSESGDTAIFTLTRTGETSSPLAIAYSVSGTAAQGADYVLSGGSTTYSGTATFAAGISSITITLTPVDDLVVDGGETATLTLSSSPDYVISPTGGSASATIADAGSETLLRGQWRLDETSGTALADGSGNGQSGTLSGGTWGSGDLNGGLFLSGGGQYADIAHKSAADLGAGAFTISAWVKLDLSVTTLGDGADYPILSNGLRGATTSYTLDVMGGATYKGLYFAIGASPGSEMGATTDVRSALLDHGWHLVTAARDSGGVARLYLDGVLVGTSGTTFTQSVTNTNSVWIGKGNTGGTFKGALDDVRVYATALSTTEVAMLAGENGISIIATDNEASVGSDTGKLVFTRTGASSSAVTIRCTLTGTAALGGDYYLTDEMGNLLAQDGNILQLTIPAWKRTTKVVLHSTTDNIAAADKSVLLTLLEDAVSNASFTSGAATVTLMGDRLLGLWKLDETSGTTVADSSGNGMNGAIMTTAFTTGTNPQSVVSADLDKDGRQDLVIPNRGSNNVYVYQRSTGWTLSFSTGSSTAPVSVVAADFNGDGKIDLATANRGTNNISVLMNTTSGSSITFASAVTYASGSIPLSIVAADINVDGKIDLVVANSSGNTVSILLGNGDGTFRTQTTIATGTGPYCVIAQDLSGDGKTDLVTANYSASTVSVLLGNGDGTFQAKRDYATGNGPYSVVAADLSGDGKADLVTANYTAGTVSVLAGNGEGTFVAKSDFTAGSTPYALTTADFTGDGKADIAVSNYSANTVSVLINGSSGGATSLAAPVAYTTGSNTNPCAVLVMDFDSSDRLDLITANYASSTLTVLLGNGDGTFQTNARWDAGHLGGSLNLNTPDQGHPQYVVVNTADGSGNNKLQFGSDGKGSFTLAVWVKFDTSVDLYTSNTGFPILSRGQIETGWPDFDLSIGGDGTGGNGSHGYGGISFGAGQHILGGDGNGVELVPVAGAYNVNVDAVLNDHQWHQITATRDSQGVGRVYLDGQLVGMGYNMGGAATDNNPGDPYRNTLWIGRGGWAQGFNGRIDNVQIFGRAVSAEEAWALANPSSVGIAADHDASEPGGTGQFTVTRDGETSSDITVYYTITGTATGGVDYTTLAGSVVIPAGQTSAAINVAPMDDSLIEGPETVQLTLAASGDYVVASSSNATLTISDNDVPGVTLSSLTPYASESGQSGQFVFTRSGSGPALTVSDLTVYYSIAGTAANTFDYSTLSGSIVIPAGQTSATLDIVPVSDGRTEGGETVSLALANSGNYTIASPTQAFLIIFDNYIPTLSISASTPSASETGPANGIFTVTRSGSDPNLTAYALTVFYTLTGTAIVGADYVALSGSVVIPVGMTSADIIVSPIDDLLMEGSETVIATLSPYGQVFDLIANGLIDQADMDYLIESALQTNYGDANLDNKVDFLDFQALLDHWQYGGGWAQGDFDGNGTVDFFDFQKMLDGWDPTGSDTPMPGQGDINGDGMVNAADIDALYAVFTARPGARYYKIGGSSSATVTIADNESVPVTITATTSSASESGPTAGAFTVTRIASGLGLASDLTVYYTISGTATNTTDYATLSGSVVIPAGQASAVITVTPVNDTKLENAQTVILTLAAGRGYTIGSASSDTVTIADNDSITETFETGAPSGGVGWSGSWTFGSNTSIVTSGAPHGGTRHLMLTSSNGSAVRTADLSEVTGAHLKFYYKANSFESGEYAHVEIYTASGWVEVLRVTDPADDNTYHLADINLSSYSLTAGFQFRITSHMSGTTDYFYIDDITIQ